METTEFTEELKRAAPFVQHFIIQRREAPAKTLLHLCLINGEDVLWISTNYEPSHDLIRKIATIGGRHATL